ncbi:hypothetical protein HVS_07580 [Acetivibrio saccincola]|uniref:HTH IS408-type domain-containing protein n=2 Tax=Acetivibrio saccincola TaxID=1677857 RepID=A0A2K9ELH2_9FIRM|nr:hypothetical protein HVS_07580 [Acetivibrio saccincola]
MLKAREILRLKHEVGLSLREIGQACNCGKTTVSEILKRAEKANITWPIQLSDKQLMSMLYPPTNNRKIVPEPDMEEELEKFINRPFQKMEGNRKTAFKKIDKPCLQPLPATKYEYCDWVETRVAFNYHVEYKGFFYSVHYSYANHKCWIRASSKTIEVYIGNERIAVHTRNYDKSNRYKTLEEHMPEEHKAVYAWSSERFLSWAEKNGPYTRELIKKILESSDYPVQCYRTCMGIMRLAKSCSVEIIETVSKEAIDKNVFSFKYFNIILKQVVKNSTKKQNDTIIRHENVRGSSAYSGGGIYAN